MGVDVPTALCLASFGRQGVRVKESTVFTRKYCTELTSLSMLSVFEVEIWCYRGGNTIPKWINRQAGVCRLSYLSHLSIIRAIPC